MTPILDNDDILRAVRDFLRAWYGVDRGEDIHRRVEAVAEAYEEEVGDWMTDD